MMCCEKIPLNSTCAIIQVIFEHSANKLYQTCENLFAKELQMRRFAQLSSAWIFWFFVVRLVISGAGVGLAWGNCCRTLFLAGPKSKGRVL